MIDVEIDAEEVGGRYLGKPALLIDYFEEPGKKVSLSQPYDQPLRQRCQRKCCAYTLWTKYIDANLNMEQQLLVPLQNVHIKSVINAGHAMIDIELTYKNVGEDNPIECTFEFPLDNKTLVSRLVAHIDDKTVEAKIKEKEEAKQQYSDAVASGNTAVYAQRSKIKNEEAITLVLGNLLPH